MSDIDRNIGIYKITSPSGKVYIGETGDLKKREYQYRTLQCKSQRFLYHSLKKYGWENHTFEVIGNCLYEDLRKLEHLITAEYRELLGERNVMTLRTYYEDKCYTAESTRKLLSIAKKGKKHSEEGLKKRKETQKRGIEHPNYGKKRDDETKEKISLNRIGKYKGEKSYWYGKNLPKEITDKISNTLKGRNVGELNPNYGRKHTDEERKKMSDANVGRILSQEIRDKISKSTSGEKHHFYGKKHSEETRKLQSDVKKGKKCSEEQKNKLKLKINQYDKNGKFIKMFPSVVDIEEFYNKDMSAIPRVCKGNQKTAYLYIWRYNSDYPDCKDLIL